MIYILQSCDEWKTPASMRIVTATAFLARLYDVIADEIGNNDMSFDGQEGFDAAAEFKAQSLPGAPDIDQLNARLGYGLVTVLEDGEVL